MGFDNLLCKPKVKDIGTYDNGLYHGKWVFYYENGKKEKEGTLKSGNAHDNWVFYNDKGEKTQQGTFNEGVKDGKWTAYFEDGKLTEGEYKNGKKTEPGQVGGTMIDPKKKCKEPTKMGKW